MQKIKIDNWKWHIEDQALLADWFSNRDSYMQNSFVKKNPVRIVYKVEDLFFVKQEQPETFWRKLRNYFFPKASREFAIGKELELSGVPVVRHLGWAQNGSSNILLTEALPNSRSVLEYWYSEIVYGGTSPKKFIESFADFLKLFFISGFYHPDFHLGNILYSPSEDYFALVDVYGVTRPDNLSKKQINRHSNIFLELAQGLSDNEAVDLILKVRSELTREEALDFWEKGLVRRKEKALKNMEKRLNQIKNNYSKFIAAFKSHGNDFLVRKQPGAIPTVKISDIPACLNGNNFDVIRLSAEEAVEIWEKSFRAELLGIDHIRPLVFEKPGTLYYEKLPESAHKPSEDIVERFLKRAYNSGIKIDKNSIIQFPSGRVVCKM